MGSAVLGIDLDYVKPSEDRVDKSINLQNDGLDKNQTFHGAYDAFFTPSSLLGQILLYAEGFVPTRWLPLEANREFVAAMNWIHETLRGLIRQRYRDVSAAAGAGQDEDKNTQDMVTFIVKESMPSGVAEGIGEDEFLGHVSIPYL